MGARGQGGQECRLQTSDVRLQTSDVKLRGEGGEALVVDPGRYTYVLTLVDDQLVLTLH